MFNVDTIMSFFSLLTPQLGLSFGIALSLAVTIGCAVGIHKNSITNTLLDWFIFAFLGTTSACLLTGTCPSYPVQVEAPLVEGEDPPPQDPVSFLSIFNREFFLFVGVLVVVGGFFHGTLNVLSQGRDTFMEAVHHVTNVFSSNEVEVVETE